MSKLRPPIRTLKEVAQHLGITAQALGKIMRHDKEAPQPVLQKGTCYEAMDTMNKQKKNYYDLSEMKVWWAARQEVKSHE